MTRPMTARAIANQALRMSLHRSITRGGGPSASLRSVTAGKQLASAMGARQMPKPGPKRVARYRKGR
jgi:hypothetical protein